MKKCKYLKPTLYYKLMDTKDTVIRGDEKCQLN